MMLPILFPDKNILQKLLQSIPTDSLKECSMFEHIPCEDYARDTYS